MGRKVGEKEKFSFGVICDEKSEKAHLSAYGRLRRSTASVWNRKDAKEARLAPSETDQPRFLHCQESTDCVFLRKTASSCKSAASRYAP